MNTTREQLAAVQARINELRGKRKTAASARDAAKASFAASGAKVDSADFRRAKEAADDLRLVEAELELAQGEQVELLQAFGDGRPPRAFLGTDAYEALDRMAHSSAPLGRVNLGEAVPQRDVQRMIGAFAQPTMAVAGEATIGDTARSRYFGVATQPRRALRLLDLIPALPMDAGTFDYSQETGAVGGAAAETVEGAAKPAATVDYLDAEARARTVAHYTKVKKQQLADLPMFEGILRDRLAYGVLRRLENQIVAGDGVGENLRGITATTGVGAVAFDPGQESADLALEGLVAVLLSEATPNFIALNPRDWANMLKAKSTGSGEYFSGGPFVARAQELWGVMAVPSTAVAQGTALVGDATLGATVFVREGIHVLLSDSDQDDFTKNKVTLLGEGRFALAIWQPAAFAVVDLAA